MKVCLHIQPRSQSLGGCEVLVALVAMILNGTTYPARPFNTRLISSRRSQRRAR
jgi:hypothetical protein